MRRSRGSACSTRDCKQLCVKRGPMQYKAAKAARQSRQPASASATAAKPQHDLPKVGVPAINRDRLDGVVHGAGRAGHLGQPAAHGRQQDGVLRQQGAVGSRTRRCRCQATSCRCIQLCLGFGGGQPVHQVGGDGRGSRIVKHQGARKLAAYAPADLIAQLHGAWRADQRTV